ncbi:hypothetical protein ACVIIW_006429 [Bradyrhizobium sp. USDA 4449]
MTWAEELNVGSVPELDTLRAFCVQNPQPANLQPQDFSHFSHFLRERLFFSDR